MKQFRTVFARSSPGRSPLCPSRIGIPETKEAITHHPDHNDFILCQSIARRSRHESGKNASQTCICERSVTRSSHGIPSNIGPGSNRQARRGGTLQSIHCGLPASWTRARRHPPSSPSPVASRGGGRGFAFLNWTRVQLDRLLVRRKAPCMGVCALINPRADLFTDSSPHGLSSIVDMVRVPGVRIRRALRVTGRCLSHPVGFRCIIRKGSLS
jgi:hypothetical protein